jgi:hypothetical protein
MEQTQKTLYRIPTTKLTSFQAYTNIGGLLNGNPSQELYTYLYETFACIPPETIVYYHRMNIPKDLSEINIKRAIGQNGCYLKLTTQRNNCMFIWHEKKTETTPGYFHIFSKEKPSIYSSIKILKYRLFNSLPKEKPIENPAVTSTETPVETN